jgi:hypothetical protein
MAHIETAKAMRKMADGAVIFVAKVGVVLDYTADSIDRLEQYLSELHDFLRTPESTWTEAQKWSAALTFGAYVGEVLRRGYGGEWQAGTLGSPKLVIGAVEIRPAEKVMKRLKNGVEDHIGLYYRMVLTCIAAAPGKQEPAAKLDCAGGRRDTDG